MQPGQQPGQHPGQQSGHERRPELTYGRAEVRHAHGWTVVAVAGEVDVASEPQLSAAIAATATAPSPHVLVDLRETTFLDSSGVAALAAVYRTTRSRGGHFVLEGAQGPVERVLEITGLRELAEGAERLPQQLRRDPA